MTPRDALYVKIMGRFGWTVVKQFSDAEHSHWKATKGKTTITQLGVDTLFEAWLDNDDVLSQVLKVTVKRSGKL